MAAIGFGVVKLVGNLGEAQPLDVDQVQERTIPWLEVLEVIEVRPIVRVNAFRFCKFRRSTREQATASLTIHRCRQDRPPKIRLWMLEIDQRLGPQRGHKRLLHQIVGVVAASADNCRISEQRGIQVANDIVVIEIGHPDRFLRHQLRHTCREQQVHPFVTGSHEIIGSETSHSVIQARTGRNPQVSSTSVGTTGPRLLADVGHRLSLRMVVLSLIVMSPTRVPIIGTVVVLW